MGESHASEEQRAYQTGTLELLQNLVYAKQSVTQINVYTNNLAHLNGACGKSTLEKSVIVN